MAVRLAMVGMAALLLAGCGSEGSGTVEGEDGTVAHYKVDEASGEVNATLETADGTATMRSGADVPVELPRGFTIYPGAKVTTNTVFEQADANGALVTMESDASPEEMVAFYRKQAEAAGVEIGLNMNTDTMQMIGGDAPDGATFSFTATRKDGGTTAQLMVGEAFR
ncbi:hypothetical protein [Pelagerythrobacter rhizovicinus]|uniref:Copper chaperone PCu(A)C n=1 Tax=Pelagerythrobacter rhizovicinus TaxID=2268576 RepID=A0A4Q2KMD7_9SPHN|nr:hypothetical protein [Pelagerythrobacter rhizovicinus]RXZ65649.1 hypothetical protein ETX26_02605 [Pelagerythrobacter rhizovicinus]